MASAPADVVTRVIEESNAPPCDDPARVDVRELGPPKPLKETLERLTELPADGVLIQLNDRVPQHLFPRLGNRGFEYESVEYDDLVATAIWHAE